MKSFKKQFPSLHLKTWIIGLETDVKSGTIYGKRSVLKDDDTGKYIKTSDVQKHCLDKQKVIKAFKDVRELTIKYLNYYDDLLKTQNQSTGCKVLADIDKINRELFGDEE